MSHPGPFILSHDRARALAVQAVQDAPVGWKVTISEPKRTDRQNERIQPMIREWAEKVDGVCLNGEWVKLGADDWRHILVAAFRREKVREVLFDKLIISLGVSSKDLTIKECSEFIEFLHAAAAQRGFKLTSVEPEPTGKPR